jgi:hypothetical protein
MAVRQEEQSIWKRYQVIDYGGFIIGFVIACIETEALRLAHEQYGPSTKLGCEFELNEFTEQLEDEIGHRILRPSLIYRSAFIPVVKSTPVFNETGAVVRSALGFTEDIEGGVEELLNQWFRAHPGTQIIHFSNTKDPSTGFAGFLIIYYQIIELPVILTLDERSREPLLTAEDLDRQNDFLHRLTTDLRSNRELFEYAEALGVEWPRHNHPITDRGSCVMAVRRFHRWI